MYDDEEMQEHFETHFYRRPMSRWRNFNLENFINLPEVHRVFEFQGWEDLLLISKDIYTEIVTTFYNTLNTFDEDNTSLRSIIRSFEL